VIVEKLDLSKEYDRVNWLYLRMLLIHVGFSLDMINWIITCVSYVSYAVLVNGSTTYFFVPSRGLLQGFSFPPILFFLWWKD
jgi:hypothetical protein